MPVAHSDPAVAAAPEDTDPAILAAMSDADLLDAWTRDQQRRALSALIVRYSPLVLSVCRRRCRLDTDVDDAYQSTFLYLARNAAKIRQPERLAGWLLRVAQRAALATLPSNHRETSAMVDPPDRPEDPLDRLSQRHEAIVLDEELADLPEHYRSAIVLHLYEDRSLQQLAEHFGTTIGSIRGRLQRGKRLLAQRLRRRGVVPVLAYAAAQAWTVSDAQAAEASDALIERIADDAFPDSPIDPPVLESLLSHGVRVMPALSTLAAAVGGSTLVLWLLMADGTHGQTAGNQEVVLAASEAPASMPEVAIDATIGQMASGVMGGAAGPGGGSGSNMTTAPRAVRAQATSPIAIEVRDKLNQRVDLDLTETLQDLPQKLTEQLDIPVLLDSAGTTLAEIDPAGQSVTVQSQQMPLATALRTALRPVGMQAIVEDEGLVITADPAALADQGVATSRWLNVDRETVAMIEGLLNDKVNSFEFRHMPLSEAVAAITDQTGLPIHIDRRALEEIGLTSDEPVNATFGNVKLRSLLTGLLRDLDLTYTLRDESLTITTIEAAEQALLGRIYWLEGTGIAVGDEEMLIDTIVSTITPDTWDRMGGLSTITPLNSVRPALVVSATYETHMTIENLLQVLRESHVGDDPVLEEVPVRRPPGSFGSGMGGMGGGGMGGMGGGGMF